MKTALIAAFAALALGACMPSEPPRTSAPTDGTVIYVTGAATVGISTTTTEVAATCVDPCGRPVAAAPAPRPVARPPQPRPAVTCVDPCGRPVAQPRAAAPAVAAVPAPGPTPTYLRPASAPPGAVATTHAYWDQPQFDCTAHGGVRTTNPATGRPSCFMNHGPQTGQPPAPTN